ncbi:MAG TPA: hypothetical protein VGL60_08960 [Acidimicrobiales bacterium]
MRRTLGIAVVLGLAAVVGRAAAIIWRWRAQRAPRSELDGHRPVVGSIDTWPPVPRAPVPGPAGGPGGA